MPASRQEYFPTSTYSLYIQLYSIDESGLEPQPERMAECALLAHHRNLTSFDQLVRSALGLGCGSFTKSMYEIWHEEHDV